MKFGEFGTLNVTFGMTFRGFSSGWNCPTRESNRVAIDPRPVVLGQRIELLGLLPDAEIAFEDQVVGLRILV